MNMQIAHDEVLGDNDVYWKPLEVEDLIFTSPALASTNTTTNNNEYYRRGTDKHLGPAFYRIGNAPQVPIIKPEHSLCDYTSTPPLMPMSFNMQPLPFPEGSTEDIERHAGRYLYYEPNRALAHNCIYHERPHHVAADTPNCHSGDFYPLCSFPSTATYPQDTVPPDQLTLTHKMRMPEMPTTIVSTTHLCTTTTNNQEPQEKKRKIGNSDERRDLVPPTPRLGVSAGDIESSLKRLGAGSVSLHVYESAQRIYIRYLTDVGTWQMRDLADFIRISFHTEEMIDSSPFPMPPDISSQGVATSSHESNVATDDPTNRAKELSRELIIEFKRKEHYWRRGIWIRVIVDVVTKAEGGDNNQTLVRDAGGSINVALLSVKGKVIKKACEKCSKYYFRYKNIESSGQAPAFEIEERERCTTVRGGKASFNMRVWECSHHYLSPHTLVFSWVDPANPCMKVTAVCPKEIVISSGSGQEKKLKEMTVSREELNKDFVDALVLMENAQYCRAIETLRCIRWKVYHFMGTVLPSCLDEKIGDCHLRLADYHGAIEHYTRSLALLNLLEDHMDRAVWHYAKALVTLKLCSAYYQTERDSSQTFNLEKTCNTLNLARREFQMAETLDDRSNSSSTPMQQHSPQPFLQPLQEQQCERREVEEGFGNLVIVDESKAGVRSANAENIDTEQGDRDGNPTTYTGKNTCVESQTATGRNRTQQQYLQQNQRADVLLSFTKGYLRYCYHQDLAGMCLRLKPFRPMLGKDLPSVSHEDIAQEIEQVEQCMLALQRDPRYWGSDEMVATFAPLLESMHITTEELKKLLSAPFLTNSVISQFCVPYASTSASERLNERKEPQMQSQLFGLASSSLSPFSTFSSSGGVAASTTASSSSSSASSFFEEEEENGFSASATTMPRGMGRLEKVLMCLGTAVQVAEEVYPKGHRAVCISRCLLSFFMYLAGRLSREDALRKVEESLRHIEKFWKSAGGTCCGRFECQQVTAIAEFVRSGQWCGGSEDDVFALLDDREHLQLYRYWIHCPMDVVSWVVQVQGLWGQT